VFGALGNQLPAQASFDPCVVNHVGFLLGPSYPQSVLDALHVVRLVCCRLLKMRKERVEVWVHATL